MKRKTASACAGDSAGAGAAVPEQEESVQLPLPSADPWDATTAELLGFLGQRLAGPVDSTADDDAPVQLSSASASTAAAVEKSEKDHDESENNENHGGEVCAEADQLLMEIFVQGSYCVHPGLTNAIMRQSSAARHDPPVVTVLDVGANIGLFALYVQQCFDRQLSAACASPSTTRPPRLSLHCFEPLPPVCAILRDVASQVSARCPSTTMYSHGHACGSNEGSCTFTYYKDSPAESTRWPEERAAQQETLKASAKQRQQVLRGELESRPEQDGVMAKRARLEPGLELQALDLFVGEGLVEGDGTGEQVGEGHEEGGLNREAAGPHLIKAAQDEGESQHVCRVRTLAAFMQEEGLSSVGLLKVDAEADELDVLQGIRYGGFDGWPLIQEVLVEVHDVDGRLQNVLDILKHDGKFPQVDAALASTWITAQSVKSPISGCECAGYVSFLPPQLKLYMVHARR